MRLFKVLPDAYNKSSPHTYQPEEGIALSFICNVPCLTADSYGWVNSDLYAKGIDPNLHILPIVLMESTKKELQAIISARKFWSTSILIKYASLHKSSDGINFLKEKDCSEDKDVLVSLELPLSAAQPYYEFEGDVEVVLGKYATYYGDKDGNSHEVEKENALSCAIVRMGDGAKLSFTYTNRFREGKIIENLVGSKFAFICYGGQLLKLDDCNFQRLFSKFTISED